MLKRNRKKPYMHSDCPCILYKARSRYGGWAVSMQHHRHTTECFRCVSQLGQPFEMQKKSKFVVFQTRSCSRTSVTKLSKLLTCFNWSHLLLAISYAFSQRFHYLFVTSGPKEKVYLQTGPSSPVVCRRLFISYFSLKEC